MGKRSKRKASSSSQAPSSPKIPKFETPQEDVIEEDIADLVVPEEDEMDVDSVFIEESRVADDEARRKWPYRYLPRSKKRGNARHSESFNGVDYLQAKKHYTEALIDGLVNFKLGDDGYVQSSENEDNFICKVIEMFEGVDGILYFRAQWFYRAKDTIIGVCSHLIDNKRIFLSEVKDDNILDCLLQKLTIVQVPLNAEPAEKLKKLGDGDYFYDMAYLVPFSTYQSLPSENKGDALKSECTISADCYGKKRSELRMLDLYSGCGAMSTGLCLGANMADTNLVTKWAVDMNEFACASLKLNHPETEVRNESAEDFLSLLREWAALCQRFNVVGAADFQESDDAESDSEIVEKDESSDGGAAVPDDGEIFEVEKIVGVCYGDPKQIDKSALYFKVNWKGYGPEEDTWEPIETLNDCKLKLKEFVLNGYKSKLLPVPGDCDVICGGPPCQGISGFNRFRNKVSPLDDEKNHQLVVYMDIVDFLKPRFCIMENVVDIVKFAKGYLGRYALGRLVANNYQARVGLMVAGYYGLPQFRMRMFMWGAAPNENLPQYPLPTHRAVSRGNSPLEFESNYVVHEDSSYELKRELILKDAISDLPPVANDESADEMPYGGEPITDFQRFIRLTKKDMLGCSTLGKKYMAHSLYDHRPLNLNQDDYLRVCQIPKQKGACFRDLKGVKVNSKNRVYFDPKVDREKLRLPSGKHLVPDYAMSYIDGRSTKPFGRLWWDETVGTVVTRAEPHNQVILHPEQDRVLTIRENARLQGFPDFYQLLGPIKERYIQVGNAVAVPVARTLGYSLAMAIQGNTDAVQPTFILPQNFPNMQPAAALPATVLPAAASPSPASPSEASPSDDQEIQ